MAYNHGREDRKWKLWKQAEERLLRELGIDESIIEQIRIDDRALLTVDERTLQIVLMKMQGYSTKEIAGIVGLTTGAIYARMDMICSAYSAKC